MQRFLKKGFALLLAVMLVLTSFPGPGAASGDPGGKKLPLSKIPSSDKIWHGVELSMGEKDSLTPAEQKINYNLLQLVKPELLPKDTTREQLIEQLKSQKQVSRGPARNKPDAILAYVYIQLNEGASPDAVSDYVVEITDSAPEYGLIVARVEVGRLTELAALDIVKNIKPVTPAECVSGSVMSEGDSMLSANMARAIGGIDGTGIKIGIISDGVTNRTSAIASGNLPGSLNILSNVVGGDEGTAMLEIVHDLAPGAQLYFHDCGDNIVQFTSAIRKLADAGCNIICDDIGWLDEPFYEDGYVAQYIDTLLDSYNIVYVTACGNSAQEHYQGQYRNGGDGFHNFNTGDNTTGQDLYLNIPKGASVAIRLQWNDPFGSSINDYDLHLYELFYGFPYFVDGGMNVQSGFGNPYEMIVYTNPYDDDGDFDFILRVYKYNSAASRNLEIYINTYNGASVYTNNIVAKDSIFGHAAVPDVIACGAIQYSTPTTIEKFSSQGPVTMRTETRKKPDVCGADGVRISGAGNFGETVGGVKRFYGTSAAAPHIAAIAALVWQKHPELTWDGVKARICNNATDLGAAGYDSVYGYGRANAYYAALDFFNVKFHTNGAGADYTLQVPANTKMAAVTPTWTGHTFHGWFTDAGFTTPWTFAADIVSADMELFAKWTVNKYTISFDSLGSSNTYASIEALYGTKITSPGTPAKPGYNFGGWCRDAACQKLWNFSADTVPAGNMTLYARWIPVVLPAPAAAKPTGTTYNSVTLGWQAVAWADGYEIWRLDSASGVYSKIATATSPSFTNTGLAFNKTYYYKIRAYRNSAPASPGTFTAVIAAKPLPSAPKLTAAQASYSSIKLSWAAVAGATKYELYRAASPSGKYKLLTTTSSRAYTNKSVTTGATYYYKVRAYRLASGKKVYGPYSPVVSFKTGIGAPSTIKASRASSSSIKLTWGSVAGKTKYEVWRCTTSATGKFTLVSTVSSAGYTNAKLKKGATYWYKVRAYRVAGGKKIYGNYSKVVSARP